MIPRQSFSNGDGPYGLPFMKFTLTFEGPLPSSGNKAKLEDVWNIRKKLHPQLLELSKENIILREAMKIEVPQSGSFLFMDSHHDDPSGMQIAGSGKRGPPMKLYQPVPFEDKNFMPIVRASMALVCNLDILFMRKDEPGKLITQGGDLD